MDVSDFKWYKTKNGTENVKYISELLFHSRIEPFYNDIKYKDAFSDKCYFNLLFKDVPVPYTICKNVNGTFTDDNFNLLNFNEVIDLCRKEKEIIIKPSINSSGGKGISFLSMEEESNPQEQLEATLKKYNKNFVVQRILTQQEELRKINSTSLNTVRTLSFLYKGKVSILSSFLRMGINGARLDNLSSGGINVGIDENGAFNSVAYDKDGNKFSQHPSGYVFEGNKMPSYDKIKESVKKLHARFGHFGLIGWDIAVNENSEPVFVEFNLIDTDPQPHQLANGPLFKELTDEVLDEVFGKKKRRG